MSRLVPAAELNPALSGRSVVLYRDPFVVVMLSLFVICIASVISLTVVIIMSKNLASEAGRLFALRILKVTLGMTIGLSIAFLGMVAMWVGLKETIRLSAEQGAGRAALASSGPGA